jgi:O-antigen/teichoic acid export membrane protein
MANVPETSVNSATELDRRIAPSSISRNATLNLLGSVIPMFITLVTVPPYLRLIGDIRFGVLALVWAFLGYFGLFEMGLGRATSKYIAELRSGPEKARESLFWTALLVNVFVGSLGGLMLWAVARTTMQYWLKTAGAIQVEVMHALPWLAAAVPVATLTSVLVGALEGCELFGVINTQQVSATIVFQLIPLAIAAWLGPRVDWLIAAAVIARMAANVPLLISCARHVPLRSLPRIDRYWVRRLFSYGMWISVSGVVAPLLTSLDQFVIGFVSGPQAVTYYAIPSNFARKLTVFPSSVSRALFPRFSAQQSSEAKGLALRSVLGLAGVLTPIVIVAILAVAPFFYLWLGPVVAERCSRAGELMLIGIWVNSLAYIPNGFLQAQGRPDLAAKFHVAEVIPFVALLWVGVHFGGVTGAALVWCARATGDAILLFGATELLRAVTARLLPTMALIAAAFGAALMMGDHIVVRAAMMALFGTVSILVSQSTSPEAMQLVVSRVRATIFKTRFRVTPEVGA